LAFFNPEIPGLEKRSGIAIPRRNAYLQFKGENWVFVDNGGFLLSDMDFVDFVDFDN